MGAYLFRRIKYIFYLIFLFAVILNSSGYLFIFLVQRELIKREAFVKINDPSFTGKIELLSFSVSEYERGISVQRVNEKEIRFAGKMYDIVKEERSGRKIVFHCIHDEKEDRLEKQFSKNAGREAHKRHPMNANLQSYAQLQFLPVPGDLMKLFPDTENTFPPDNISICTENIRRVQIPPPKSEVS